MFLSEAEEQLHLMEQEILNLEQNGPSDGTIQSLFRAAHTLKGSSAAMGFEAMKQLTHEMESVLEQARNHQVSVTDAMTNLLFACLDGLRRLKEDFENGAEGGTDISGLVHELKRFGDPSRNRRSGSHGVASPLPQLANEAMRKARSASEQGLALYDIHIVLAPDCPMKSARGLIIQHQLDAWGDVLHTHPSLEEAREDDADLLAGIQYLIASSAEATRISESLRQMMDVSDVTIHSYLPPAADNKPETAVVGGEGKRADRAKSQTVRVDVERLEMLMNLVGELVIDQTRISQVGRTLHQRYAADESVADLEQISDHVTRVIGELQESVMKVRMLPLERLFHRFPRMVRDLSRSLDKDVELVIEGAETELDRTVIEEIGDPLVHLLRNAVDHGLEPPEDRRRLGKPARGLLRIAAAHSDNQVTITVQDDGRGIDPAKMKDSALRKGFITEEEHVRVTDQEAIYYIFEPGFSTASTVSDVSGRGVGMDIVRNHIEKLNGVIDIDTKLGEGTRFIIKLPLTLAIITGLLARLGGSTFILPMSSVVEIVRMPLEAVQTIKGESVVVIRGKVLPVVDLHSHLQVSRHPKDRGYVPVVIVGSAERSIAFVVDELLGNQEIVVKTLGSYVGKVEGIAGATILGDGRVALILEAGAIGRAGVR